MPEDSHAGRWVRCTTEPGQISAEFAAFIRKELNNIASRFEQQHLQFREDFNKERETRIKDISKFHALRERDLAELEALKQSLHSQLSSIARLPKIMSTEQDSLLTVAAENMKKQDGTGNGADEFVHSVARLPETVSTEQGSLMTAASCDVKKLGGAENEADYLGCSIAQSPEVLSAERDHPTTIATDDVKKLDDAGTDVNSRVCSAPLSQETPGTEQCRFTTTAGSNVKKLDDDGTEADSKVCSIAQPRDILSTEQRLFTTAAVDGMEELLNAQHELANAAVEHPSSWVYAARDEVENATDEHPSALQFAWRPLSKTIVETELQCSAAMELARNELSLPNGVTFTVHCESAKLGNHVRLVGSSEDLGMWQLKNGLVLTTSEAEFPWWRLESPISISPEQLVEYKYVICDNTTGNSYEWESRANRTLKLSGQSVVKDVFGSHDDCDWAHLVQELPARLSSWQYYSRDMPREHSCSLLCTLDSPMSKMQEPGFAEDFQSCYELLGPGPLGEGAFTQVWRCCSKGASAGAEVPEHAAKIVRTGQLTDRERHDLLGEDGEIALHSRLNHPHIVHLHKHFNEGCSLTLVLEYCCGGDLFDAIVKSGGLSETASARMLRHLLMALCYLHGCLITHRDVKSENILLQHAQTDPEKNIFKLCDFGLSARIKEEGFRDRVGSADTVAPEVIRGEAYGKLVDVWSAGAVTYMALVAASPFAAATPTLTVELVKAAAFSTAGPAWRDISDMAKHTVEDLMDPDVRTRPDAERALDNVWFDEFAKD